MALTNHERVGKGMDLLKAGLAAFAEREFKTRHHDKFADETRRYVADDRLNGNRPLAEWDVSALLKLMWEAWNDVFGRTLGRAERSLVSELRDHRNRWAHQEAFSGDDAYRALDSAHRLLLAVSAPEAVEVERLKTELLRVRFDEQARSERRRHTATLIEGAAGGALKPWRETVQPHADVASGRYQQAEFAADLWQVHLGEGTEEYRNPGEFFRRTFLTESLKRLLAGAIRRIGGSGGDPVVQLQTNFGGGKTHSMLALYHLFSGAPASELLGAEAVLRDAGMAELPKLAAKPVVLVGNKISPGNPSVKADGTVVRTLWGELAWQLGGKKAYARIQADDERATSPGDALRELFREYGPSLILIDEWVAYARQLHDNSDLPGGSFETQFSFAQALTESAKLVNNCLLVVSLPASDAAGSPHTVADDVEVGGIRGREALDRLRNVVGRVESSWRPASAEEGFEIVRRRLFEPMIHTEAFTQRDVTARAFTDLYRTQSPEFPPECRESDYEKRIRAAYPIHPEVFDRLYTDWSTLVKFQRTRGVLRLMAAVIHCLWEKDDKNPLILPANIPIDDHRVQFELTRYLPDAWAPIIEKDIDGPNSLPARIDSEVPNLGRYHATRRVARTIYLGSAPTSSVANKGVEDRRVKLGCTMPGETPAIFGDALRRLSEAATYLYQDGPRYWYSTQPTVAKLAEDRAERFKRNPDAVFQEIEKRLRSDFRNAGDFPRVHVLPPASGDVPDDMDARLVVLSPDHPYSKDAGNRAETVAKSILENRGTAPRIFRNALIFLAADQSRLSELEDAARRFLAWDSILNEKETLDLTPHQVRQAETQRHSADATVKARIPEAYQWLLIPEQPNPQDHQIVWRPVKLTGTEALAVRASKKLKSDESLLLGLAGTRLRLELDRVPLWRGDGVPVKRLADDFARYLYLPRLVGTEVLIGAIRDGVALLTWENDGFAYADSFDEETGRYRGLRMGQPIPGAGDILSGWLVRPETALNQIQAEREATSQTSAVSGTDHATAEASGDAGTAPAARGASVGQRNDPAAPPMGPKRFHGTIRLESTRVGRDAGKIAEEVISHLAGLVGAEVTVTLEIEAKVPTGASEAVVRTVTENCRVLKFTSQGFEAE